MASEAAGKLRRSTESFFVHNPELSMQRQARSQWGLDQPPSANAGYSVIPPSMNNVVPCT
jgi:hypothetical protein